MDTYTHFANCELRVLRRLRDLHPDMTILQAMFLFAVATNPGASQRHIYTLIGTTDSSAARTFAILSDIGGRRSRPLHLIEQRVNPLDRRERNLYLTPRGRRLMDDMLRDFERGGREQAA